MRTKLLYVFIGLLVILHIASVAFVFRDPKRFQTRDSQDYLDLARTFLSTGRYAGTEYPGVDFMRPPAYPLLVALGLLVGQGITGYVSLLQVLILLASAWLLYSSWEHLGHRVIGLISVVIFLLNPNATFWSLMQMTETLAGFFITLAFWCLVRYWKSRKYAWLLGAGLSLSASALTRPITLPLAILLGLVFLVIEWYRTHKPEVALKGPAIFLLAVLGLVIPWQLRNLAVHGNFALSEVGESTFQNWYVAQTLASAEGFSRDEASTIIAKSDDPLRYSLQVIRTYPVVFVKENVRGILRTALGAEYGTWATAFTGAEPETTGILSALLDQGSPSGMLSALTSQGKNPWFWAGIYALLFDIFVGFSIIIGLWKLFRGYRGQRVFRLALLLLISLAFLIIVPGVAGESRFRVPADPLLALAAGWAWLPRRPARNNDFSKEDHIQTTIEHSEGT